MWLAKQDLLLLHAVYSITFCFEPGLTTVDQDAGFCYLLWVSNYGLKNMFKRLVQGTWREEPSSGKGQWRWKGW